jgi:hypothetical protein
VDLVQLAGEATALAAVAGVLEWHEKQDVCDTLWRTGEEMMGAVRRAIAASDVRGVSVDGIAPMWLLRFDDPARESRFLELALEQDVLFKRGAYNYAAIAHDEETVVEIERAREHGVRPVGLRRPKVDCVDGAAGGAGPLWTCTRIFSSRGAARRLERAQ